MSRQPKVARAVRVSSSAGRMNSWEAAYSSRLRQLELAGEVLWWAFEPVKLRLAGNTFYSPDFLVVTSAGEVELHEVKGFWREDARVKIKVAAQAFPMFRFVAASKRRKSDPWSIEVFA